MTQDVVLAYTCGNIIRPPFFRAVSALQAQNSRVWALSEVQDLYLPRGRNTAVRSFLDTEAQWLWFVDTDIEFPPDALDWLLAAAEHTGKKIIAGAYWGVIVNGYSLVTWFRDEDGILYPYAKIPPSGLMKIAACGMGCTLIHREVFETMQANWEHEDPWIWFGHDLIENGSGKLDRAGEDVTFCLRARKQGFTIYGLCDLVVEHYKLQPQPKDAGDLVNITHAKMPVDLVLP